jgi:hypothetical protein
MGNGVHICFPAGSIKAREQKPGAVHGPLVLS